MMTTSTSTNKAGKIKPQQQLLTVLCLVVARAKVVGCYGSDSVGVAWIHSSGNQESSTGVHMVHEVRSGRDRAREREVEYHVDFKERNGIAAIKLHLPFHQNGIIRERSGPQVVNTRNWKKENKRTLLIANIQGRI